MFTLPVRVPGLPLTLQTDPVIFGFIVSADRAANLHFPGGDLAEDATKKVMLVATVAKGEGKKKTTPRKNFESDDILKRFECQRQT